VFVALKRPPHRIFGAREIEAEQPNYLRFRLGPEVEIAIGARSKTPGEELVGEHTELLVTQDHHRVLGAYDRLLGEAMEGDSTLFARQDEVETAWRVVDPVLDLGPPVNEYARGTWGPNKASEMVSAVGGWHEPAAR
jgi:glucose-6-phosphate 1-dehydrogenase